MMCSLAHYDLPAKSPVYRMDHRDMICVCVCVCMYMEHTGHHMCVRVCVYVT